VVELEQAPWNRQRTSSMKQEERKASPAEYWCNFCGFRSDDEEEYLRHSCTKEIERKGENPAAGRGRNHCS